MKGTFSRRGRFRMGVLPPTLPASPQQMPADSPWCGTWDGASEGVHWSCPPPGPGHRAGFVSADSWEAQGLTCEDMLRDCPPAVPPPPAPPPAVPPPPVAPAPPPAGVAPAPMPVAVPPSAGPSFTIRVTRVPLLYSPAAYAFPRPAQVLPPPEPAPVAGEGPAVPPAALAAGGAGLLLLLLLSAGR